MKIMLSEQKIFKKKIAEMCMSRKDVFAAKVK